MPARFPHTPILALVGVVLLVLAMANPAAAPPGDLDTTFDGDGKVITSFVGGIDRARAVAIQGDGKIVAAGEANVGTFDFALARYNTDGSLDTIFSGDGKVTTDFAGGTHQAFAVAIQSDRKIWPRGASGSPGISTSAWPGTRACAAPRGRCRSHSAPERGPQLDGSF